MLTLTLEEVKKNARDYYDKELLTAQHPDPDQRRCRNKLENFPHRCAVAASYPQELCDKYPMDPLFYLKYRGEIDFSKADGDEILKIQTTHDNWAIRSNRSHDKSLASEEKRESWTEAAEEAKEEFLKLIN